MILDTGVIALLFGSFLIAFLVLASTWTGVEILRFWDIESGSSRQLSMERKTYLVSTLIANALVFELISLILFVSVVDGIAPSLVGAMCAVGVLKASRYGLPALLLKLGNFLFAGIWLVINHSDNLGRDYPLIRVKYRLLLVLAPLVVAEAVLQLLFFRQLKPDVITSCCGSLFSTASRNGLVDFAAITVVPGLVGLGLLLFLLIAAGVVLTRTGRGGLLFSAGCALFFCAGIVVLIGAVSPYIYELPTHHCPFCFLHREYRFIGYPLYGALFSGTICGIGAGLLSRWHQIPSLVAALPFFQKLLVHFTLSVFILFSLLAIGLVWSSHLTMTMS